MDCSASIKACASASSDMESAAEPRAYTHSSIRIVDPYSGN
jgi:hypothetical protein